MTRENSTIGESERWLSVIVGGMLALSSLRRRDLGAGALFALGGAAMIYRGLAGHDGFFGAVGGALGQALDVGGGDRTTGDRSQGGGSQGDRGEPSGRGRSPTGAADEVEEASMESFPASDAPSWTPTSGSEAGADAGEAGSDGGADGETSERDAG